MNSTTQQTITLNELKDQLYKSIEDKDKDKTLSLVSQLIDLTLKDPEAVNWITMPEVITGLHDKLAAAYTIPVQNFRLGKRAPSKGKRAYLFAKMMEIGLSGNNG